MPPKHNQTTLDAFYNQPGKTQRLDDGNGDDEPEP